MFERQHTRRRIGDRIRNDDRVEVRTVRANVDELAQLLFRRRDAGDGTGVVQDVLDLPAEERRIDRNRDGGGGENAEVAHRPLGPVFGEDRDAVSSLDAERAQSGREPANGVAELGERDFRPAIALLVLQCDRPIELDRQRENIRESLDLHPEPTF